MSSTVLTFLHSPPLGTVPEVEKSKPDVTSSISLNAQKFQQLRNLNILAKQDTHGCQEARGAGARGSAALGCCQLLLFSNISYVHGHTCYMTPQF